MAPPRSQPASYDDEDRHPPGQNFPGFDYGTSIVGAMMQGASDQSAILNDAWQRVSKGRFGIDDWLKSLSGMWQSYFSTVEGLLRSPPWSTPSPDWVSFTFNPKDQIALKHTIQLSQPLDPTVKFDVTSLRALGGTGRIRSRYITVIRRERHGGRAVVVTIDKKGLVDQPPGQYMGFVVDPRTSGEAPFLVILLRIVGEPREEAMFEDEQEV